MKAPDCEAEVGLQPDATADAAGRQNSKSSTTLPPELAFLSEPECNPDLTDPHVQKQGHMRETNREDVDEGRGHCSAARECVGWIVSTWTVQTIVLLVIFYDFIMTMIGFTNQYDEDHEMFSIGNWLTIIVLSGDVLARFFYLGKPFLHSKLNVFELILVPITVFEIFFLTTLVGEAIPVSLLRVLRPIFRGVRILRVLARAASKTNRYLTHLRHQVSGDRIRFMQDGFDLDLAYITGQIVAMSVPAVGREAWVRNPAPEVARFLNERHGNNYLLLNVTREAKYPTAPFFHRVMQFKMHKDSVPNLQALLELCRVLDAYLKADPQNVIAVHSKHGQGRASLVIIAFLIYKGVHRTKPGAIQYFEHTRVEPEKRGTASTQTIDSASQHRFLEYFSYICSASQFDRKIPLSRPVKLKRIMLFGLPNIQQVDVCCFTHPGVKLRRKKFPQLGRQDSSISGVEGDEEDDDEQGTGSDGKQTPKEKGMRDQAKKTLEEGTWDSIRSGTNALTGEPAFSSYPDSTVSHKVTAKVAPAKDDGMSPGAWELAETELSGEFRIEIHRRKKEFVQSPDSPKMGKSSSKLADPESSTRRVSVSGGKVPDKEVSFDGGLMVACWLHTAYLEHDEEKLANRRQKPNQVVVYLDRFALDKGSFAPSLKNHSAGLRLQLEFEVDERKEKETVAEEDNETRFKLTASAQVSDTETLHWLTWVASKIWPSFESGFKSLVEGLIPGLRDSLPGPLKKLELTSFSLGDSYPKFGPITASTRRHDGFEIQLDIVLDYSTAVDIVLEVPFASFAITHLSIHGVLVLKFKPLLPELPVFTAMQILFLNSPKIDLKFAKTLEIANSSVVRKHIFGAINKGLGDLMVLPNIMNINWADPDDLSDKAVNFRNVLPCAVLRLRIMEARNLSSEGSMFRTIPDAYVQVQLGTQMVQTRPIRQNANPVWDQDYDLLLYDERQTVNVSVFDLDLANISTNIGSAVEFKVADIICKGQEGEWIDLLPQKSSTRSKILLQASVFDLDVDPRELEVYCKAAAAESAVASSPLSADASSPGGRKSGNSVNPDAIAQENIGTDGIDIKGTFVATEERREAGTVVLLACEVLGGRLPGDLHTPKDLILKVSVGDAEGEQACVDAPPEEGGVLGERQTKAIQRLAANSVPADVIANALGESEADVYRVMRKQGWNLDCPQKICVMAHPQDLASATSVKIQALTNNKKRLVVATGRLPISRILQTTNCRHAEVISCHDTVGSLALELDIEVRLYALKRQASAQEDELFPI